MSTESAYQPIAPTVSAIDEWLGREARSIHAGRPTYGVNVKTKAGSWRCISGPSCKVEEELREKQAEAIENATRALNA